ncbi:MAG: response regulator [Bacteroidetes bacterium]|nr:MAG: response regulator [Bacteroidota bacterium]
MKKLKCLIVDDDLIARKSLERLCTKVQGLEVTGSCTSGEEALDRLQHEPVDILFLDLDMPGMDGKQLLNQLPASQRVVLVTGKVNKLNGTAARAAAVLTKPVNPEQFKKAISRLV